MQKTGKQQMQDNAPDNVKRRRFLDRRNRHNRKERKQVAAEQLSALRKGEGGSFEKSAAINGVHKQNSDAWNVPGLWGSKKVRGSR
jgi:hypothetical protein